MSNWKINDAIKAVWTFIRALNKYIDVTAPGFWQRMNPKQGHSMLYFIISAKDSVLFPLWQNR